MSDVSVLPRDEIRELFDLRSSHNEYTGGGYHDDRDCADQDHRMKQPAACCHTAGLYKIADYRAIHRLGNSKPMIRMA